MSAPLQLLAPLLCASSLLAAEQDERPTWIADFDAARAVAREAHKDLLVDFTGSDWCGWCMKLDEEVFGEKLFLDAVAPDYVLVKLDLPRTLAALELVPDIKRNRALVREYDVRGYPSVLLMTADGEVFGRTGYREGGAASYVKHLGELRARGRPPLVAANELLQRFEAASPQAREALLEEAIAQLEGAPSGGAVAGKLARIAGHALALDPKNERGLLARALGALLPSGHANNTQIARAESLDPRNRSGLLELAVLARLLQVENERQVRDILAKIDALDALGPIRDPEAARLIYVNAAQWHKSFRRDTKASRRYARKARPLVQDDEALAKKIDALLRG